MTSPVSLPGMMSPYFTGAAVGETIPAAGLPASDLMIDDSHYDYEGNWAFCVFDGDEAPAARFGFGRGMVDLADYGGSLGSKSFLMLHIELMLQAGAALWLGTGRHTASEVAISADRMENRLRTGDRTILDISGWPVMRWQMESDDGEAAVEMTFTANVVTVLPDCIMQHNYFAMWLAIAEARGEVRFGETRVPVSGTAFYDHPRIIVKTSDVPVLGWYLYTPIRMSDGSHFIAYYAQDQSGARIDYYSFGAYFDPQGNATWFPEARLYDLTFDADEKPKSWRADYSAPGMTVHLDATVRDTAILRAWGGDKVAQTRKENGNIPLVFDAKVVINGESVQGKGMAEYVPHGETAWNKIE